MNYDKLYPTLDLHGEYAFSAKELTREFINDNITLKNYKLCIIHGIGKGIVKDAVYEVLRQDKRILSYKLDFMNPGCTMVELKKEGIYE